MIKKETNLGHRVKDLGYSVKGQGLGSRVKILGYGVERVNVKHTGYWVYDLV
jgi:hypothetical protein